MDMMKRALFTFFFYLPTLLFGNHIPDEAWEQVAPYLMPDTHPLKQTLDEIFSETRVLRDQGSLFNAGFKKRKPQPKTGVIVTKHPRMKGYVFKIYTDDVLTYYRGQPEYTTWMLRARGAALVRHEIARKGWEAYFKAPIKWIYALPPTTEADPGHLQKNFILVEEDMRILPNEESKKRWQDGTITPKHLRRIFHIITTLGLRGGCKYDNIPLCKDGRIAFIDTQNNLCFDSPLPYYRLLRVLKGELYDLWKGLIRESKNSHSG